MSVKGLPDDGMRNKTTDHGPVLSYKAACLWREDALTLLPGNWLNDNILVWWYEFLAHDIYAGRKDVCLLHPGASFLCLYEHPDECVTARFGAHVGVCAFAFCFPSGRAVINATGRCAPHSRFALGFASLTPPPPPPQTRRHLQNSPNRRPRAPLLPIERLDHRREFGDALVSPGLLFPREYIFSLRQRAQQPQHKSRRARGRRRLVLAATPHVSRQDHRATRHRDPPSRASSRQRRLRRLRRFHYQRRHPRGWLRRLPRNRDATGHSLL